MKHATIGLPSMVSLVLLALGLGIFTQPAAVLALNSPTPTWTVVSSLPIYGANDATFIDAQHGWAVDAVGLASTADRGLSWQQTTLPVRDTYQRILFTDAQHGYIAGGNTVLTTSDGGASWRATVSPPVGYNDIVDIAAPTPQTLFVVATQSGVFQSTDGGATWRTVPFSDSVPGTQWSHVLCTSATDGWLTNDRWLYHTTDGGVTWTASWSAPDYSLAMGTIAFDGATGAFPLTVYSAVPGQVIGLVEYTTDDGTTWSQATLPVPVTNTMYIDDVSVGSPTQFLAASMNDLYASYDGGKTWQIETFPVGTRYIDAIGFRGTEPFVIADGNFMRHTSIAVTATPSATNTSTPIWTPAPTRTPIPTATPLPTRTPIPTSAPMPPLSVNLPQRYVVSGDALTIRLKTVPRGQISIVLRVEATRVVISGKGRHRKRARHTVVLYRLTRQGTANRHGLFTTSVQVTYKPSRPIQATITVTIRTSRGTVARTLGVTIQPLHHGR